MTFLERIIQSTISYLKKNTDNFKEVIDWSGNMKMFDFSFLIKM